jgi:hypothetical protein
MYTPGRWEKGAHMHDSVATLVFRINRDLFNFLDLMVINMKISVKRYFK